MAFLISRHLTGVMHILIFRGIVQIVMQITGYDKKDTLLVGGYQVPTDTPKLTSDNVYNELL